MRTANPAFREGTFAPANWPGIEAERRLAGDTGVRAVGTSATMTIGGTIIKSGVLLAACASAAVVTWTMASAGTAPAAGVLWVGLLVGFVLGLIIRFNPRTAPFISIPYALCQGAFLGVISLFVARSLGTHGPALVFQAIMLTFGILGALLVGFSFGVVRLGSTATKCVVVATGGVAVFYMASLVLGLFGMNALGGLMNGSGPLSIGLSLFVIVLASLNLVLDFQYIEQGARDGAPKYMEWYGAFGLLVTLVWLYIEILWLLAKLNRK